MWSQHKFNPERGAQTNGILSLKQRGSELRVHREIHIWPPKLQAQEYIFFFATKFVFLSHAAKTVSYFNHGNIYKQFQYYAFDKAIEIGKSYQIITEKEVVFIGEKYRRVSINKYQQRQKLTLEMNISDIGKKGRSWILEFCKYISKG